MAEQKKRHRHKHGILYRARRWLRHNRKTVMLGAVMALAVLVVLGYFASRTLQQQRGRHVTSGNSVNMGSGYRNITYKGKRYQYNSLITTVLYAGLDSDGVMQAGEAYTVAPQADSIYLLVLDKKNEKMSVIGLNRDTMTDIRRYTMDGRDRGTYVSHLCLAFTYGDGGRVSCENLREAVSHLLGGIPINEYVVTNRSSLPYINELPGGGGVTVTVPNNDLADEYPEFTKGAAVTITDQNIETYIRSRDTAETFSNEGRLQRQQSYISAYIEQFKDVLASEPEATWTKIQKMDDFLQTSITRNKYLSLAKLLDTVSVENSEYYFPEGEDYQGELHDEFYVDETALQKKVIDLFYEEL